MSVKKTQRAAAGKASETDGFNAERDMMRFFRRMGMMLNLPVQKQEHVTSRPGTKELVTYNIKPQEWVKHWLQASPELLGGRSGDPYENFESFWAVYQQQHSSHIVFDNHAGNLKHVVPLLIHGDEGRAVKKTNYMVVSMESPLGSCNDDRLFKCSCAEELSKRPTLPSYDGNHPYPISPAHLEVARKQITNFKGHSYLSRWLLFGMGGWTYKKNPHVFEALLDGLAEDLRALFYAGVQLDSGVRVYGAVVAVKGDMDFHKKVFDLTRSYGHLGSVNQIRICHHCFAGDSENPFEDFAEPAAWEKSCWCERPWPVDKPPALSRIPYDVASPEWILRGDYFHIFKTGIGRDLAGGIIVTLMYAGFFDSEGDAGESLGIDARFERAHAWFTLWCCTEGRSAGLHSFTKAFFNMKHNNSAPWVNSKGSDTCLLIQWLLWFLKLQLIQPTVSGHEALLRRMLQTAENAIGMNMMHVHGLWMERECARLLYVRMMSTLRGYVDLGRKAIRLGTHAFMVKPKHHALHHLAVHLRQQLESGCTLISNPQLTACDVNEDFLGRISRLSRRVGFRKVDKHVIDRYFLKIPSLLRERRKMPRKLSKIARSLRKAKFGD